MNKFKIAVFSSKPYDQESFQRTSNKNIEFSFFEIRLTDKSVSLAKGFDAVCVFVNDVLDQAVLTELSNLAIHHIVLRCAGFNNVDLVTAKQLNFKIARVPSYSPEAVAEHTVALMLTLNRKLHKAYNRVKEDNFALSGLLGFNIHGKTIGLIGTGQIGLATARILAGFSARVIAYDPYPSDLFTELGGEYVTLDTLYTSSDIISLHCPLSEQSHHLIDKQAIDKMKDNVMLINTSRGGLINTECLLHYLKNRKIGYLALDVYEQESELFFDDHSMDIIQDDIFQRLLTFPNVLITGHQGFFTKEALDQIAKTTIDNLERLLNGHSCDNLIQ